MSRLILVVDDDREMVRTLCDILRHRGWNPQGAYSGEEAVELTQTTRFPLVLMDIKMPGIDGVAAFKAIKARDPEVRVVLMTAHTAPELLEEAEAAGAAKIVTKPVDPGVLLEILE